MVFLIRPAKDPAVRVIRGILYSNLIPEANLYAKVSRNSFSLNRLIRI
jgi:hypothetical protein